MALKSARLWQKTGNHALLNAITLFNFHSGQKNKEEVMLMVVELMAFESRYTVKQKEKKIVFDDMDDVLVVVKKD